MVDEPRCWGKEGYDKDASTSDLLWHKARNAIIPATNGTEQRIIRCNIILKNTVIQET